MSKITHGEIKVPDIPELGTVHITTWVHPIGDLGRALRIHGDRVGVTLVFGKCPTCFALLLPEDMGSHATWHATQGG